MTKAVAIHLATIEHIGVRLLVNDIPFKFRRLYDGAQLVFEWAENADVICHSDNYGHLEGFVESMGFPWDNGKVTCMIADDMADTIIHFYKEREKEQE